ncbi:transposase family protein [Streptomyces sp. NPDC050529]|uniref:transposase family protein n=1 Tax=Streptomyces sp. NPDC050529 TaxID=3365624 RepID=UPI00378CFEC6
MGAGAKYKLVFVDRLLATLVHLRHGATHDVLACWFGVDRSTITRAISEVRPLLAQRGCTVTPDINCPVQTSPEVVVARPPVAVLLGYEVVRGSLQAFWEQPELAGAGKCYVAGPAAADVEVPIPPDVHSKRTLRLQSAPGTRHQAPLSRSMSHTSSTPVSSDTSAPSWKPARLRGASSLCIRGLPGANVRPYHHAHVDPDEQR